MELVRADISSGVYGELRRQWAREYDDLDECGDGFSSALLDYAGEIVRQTMNEDRFAIYVLRDPDGTMEAMAHLNVARLPRKSGLTLRVREIMVAPRYDLGEFAPERLAYIGSMLFERSIEMAEGWLGQGMRADHVKVHLPRLGDREMLMGAISILREAEHLTDVDVRGNWLEMSLASAMAHTTLVGVS